MNLEDKIKQKIVMRRTPSAEVLEQVTRGNKFVIVEEEFDQNFVPQGYTLIDMKYKDDSFKALVPQSLLFYMANPGEGDLEDALDQISDFYGEAEDYEDDMIENGATSVQEANWATLARSAYGTYLINKLVKNKRGKKDENGEPIPEYDEKRLEELDLDDKYVAERVKAIAALSLGKNQEEIKKYGIDSVLKHVTIRDNKTEKLTRAEFDKITCWAGSHYEIKEEYKGDNDGIEYQIDRLHSRGHKEGIKIIKKRDIQVLDSKIVELEDEIEKYRKEKHGEVGRHDRNLLRQYANLAYIAKENPKAQLDVMPPAENDRSS